MVELMREVGVLLIALAPLDGMLSAGQDREAVMPVITAFLELGAALFLCSVVVEWLMMEKAGLEGSK